MRDAVFFLAWDESSWRVFRANGDTVESREAALNEAGNLAAVARAVADAMTELGYDGRDVCLGLPSSMALAERIDGGNLLRKDRAAAMLYRLEEQLPVDAEQLTVDFLPLPGRKALGVAVETTKLARIVDALADRGIQVGAIRPTALLALWQFGRGENPNPNYAILNLESGADVFRLEGDKPAAWYFTGHEPKNLLHWIETDLLAQPPSKDSSITGTFIGTFEEPTRLAVSREVPMQIEHTEIPPLELAARAAGPALQGRNAGWVDLCKGSLTAQSPWSRANVKKPLQAAIALTILLPAVLAVLFYLRARQYEEMARYYQGEQAKQYRRVHPNGRAPVLAMRNLEAEWNRLAGLDQTGAMPDRPNALNLLRDAIAALPPDVRLQITDIRTGPGGVSLSGAVLQHSHAEIVANSLRKAGFVVDSPASKRQDERGITFRLKARRSDDAKQGKILGAVTTP
jgi:type II secretory pathway component PulL